MPEQMKELFPQPEAKDDYEDKLRRAIQESQRSRNNYSEDPNFVVTKTDDIDLDYNRIESGDDYSEDDDAFFSDLNS